MFDLIFNSLIKLGVLSREKYKQGAKPKQKEKIEQMPFL